MGDFLLDVRGTDERALNNAAEFLKFFPDMHVYRFRYPGFGLVLTSADNPKFWAPYTSRDGSVLVTLTGRIALDQTQWNEAEKVEGSGGLACKRIYKSYVDQGITGLHEISGNFAIVLFDRAARKLLIVTDRWGLVPAFKFEGGLGELAYSSHPDALADAVGQSRNWDTTSFAEFILAGRLSAPFTYYRRIKSLPVASVTALSFGADRQVTEQTCAYFELRSRPEPEEKLEELAEEFAAAFKQAVTRRTLPMLGRSAVALSGGLDSRTVLCASPNRKDLITFSFFDEENREIRTAKAIAREAGVEFIPLRRGFDCYGDSAALGVKISAGMGCIGSNHFLGFRSKLQELGVENLLTGCYCDYVFKGLGLNKKVNRWTTRESVSSFEFAFYCGHFSSNTPLAGRVRQRLEEVFPMEFRRYDTEAAVLEVERRRLFPLCYEEDNAERTIPQRTMAWYVPIAENALADIFLRMSCSMKLNRRLFARMVEIVCDAKISRIPDANSGAPVNASLFREALQSHLLRLGSFRRRLRPSNATAGSWLNWNFYATHSPVVRSIWSSPNPEAREIFQLVLGKDGFSPDIAAYEGKRIYLFLQLLTLKLWLDQRPR